MVLVNVFNNQSVKLTSDKTIRNASEKDSINCINNSKHIHVCSVQSFNVSIPYENNDQQENQIRVECIHKAKPYVGDSNVCDTKNCIIHENSITESGCISSGTNEYIHKAKPYIGGSNICDMKSCIIHKNGITECDRISSGVNEHSNNLNIQAYIVKYTAVQECQKSNSRNVNIWTHDTCEKGLGYVVFTGGNDTISQPCQNQVHYMGDNDISQNANIISCTDSSDLGSKNWSSTLTENLVNNVIIAYSRIEEAECLSNLSTYIDWSQLEYQAVSHQRWLVNYNISICGSKGWRHSVENSMAYKKSNVQTHQP